MEKGKMIMEVIFCGIWWKPIIKRSRFIQNLRWRTLLLNATSVDPRICSYLASYPPRPKLASSCFAENPAWVRFLKRMNLILTRRIGNLSLKTSSCKLGWSQSLLSKKSRKPGKSHPSNWVGSRNFGKQIPMLNSKSSILSLLRNFSNQCSWDTRILNSIKRFLSPSLSLKPIMISNSKNLKLKPTSR